MSSSSSSRRRLRAASTNVFITNAVYFPSSKIYEGYTPGMINYACVNQVFYAYASVAQDGSVYMSDEYADFQAPCDGVSGGLGSLMHLKKAYPHLSVILSVGGPGSCETYPLVASEPMYRANFARSAWGLVEASELDGIGVDWEYPTDAQQGANFVELLAVVRQYMPQEHLVTAALPAGRSLLQNIDIGAMAAQVDMINLAAYDFCGATWSSRSGHHAALYSMGKDDTSASSGVAYLIRKGCPAKKILMGIPAYGRSFLGVSGPGHRHKGFGGADGSFEYHELPRKHAKETVDKRIGAASCLGGDGGWVSYDNPDTVKMKANFCKQKGLGGLYYWSAPADSQEKSRSLVAAGFKALHASS